MLENAMSEDAGPIVLITGIFGDVGSDIAGASANKIDPLASAAGR